MRFFCFLFYFLLCLFIHTTIPITMISIGTPNIIAKIIVFSCSVAVYVTFPVVFLAVMSSSLSDKYAIEFNTKSLFCLNCINGEFTLDDYGKSDTK